MPALTVRHLDCATMRPRVPARLINRDNGRFPDGTMVAHCLLVEVADGLCLVDTGYGLDDVADPRGRIGRLFAGAVGPVCDPSQTAARQVEALGYARDDVRHIVLTHLDPDHAGGLGDFPRARVHLLADELAAALKPQTLIERQRYLAVQWAHGPEWVSHTADGEPWYGFDAVRDLPGLPPEILMVPLVGHTRGHAAIAVQGPRGWLLHCGDAYFHRDETHPRHPTCSAGLRLFQRLTAVQRAPQLMNQQRLRELRAAHDADVTVFCAHDPWELDQLLDGRPSPRTPTRGDR